MPVPKTVSALPEQNSRAAIKVELIMWEYGEVAEILHVGPYAEERATIEKLLYSSGSVAMKSSVLTKKNISNGPACFSGAIRKTTTPYCDIAYGSSCDILDKD